MGISSGKETIESQFIMLQLRKQEIKKERAKTLKELSKLSGRLITRKPVPDYLEKQEDDFVNPDENGDENEKNEYEEDGTNNNDGVEQIKFREYSQHQNNKSSKRNIGIKKNKLIEKNENKVNGGKDLLIGDNNDMIKDTDEKKTNIKPKSKNVKNKIWGNIK